MSRATVAYFERGKKNIHQNHVAAMQQVMEAAGIEFIGEAGGGVGVRFRTAGG